MTYFEKIEAYLSGEMNEMEQSIFEQTLEESTLLQKEYEAYKTAQSLFNFTAETLSEEEITNSSASETTEALINFTAQNLSEQEILSNTETATTQRQAIVRTLKTRKSRIEWFVAASMLFVLSLIGARFYSNPSTETLNTPSEVVAQKTIEPKIEMPVEQKNIPAPVIVEPVMTEPEAKIVKKIPKKRPTPKYEPAKVRITPKATPVVEQQHIAAVEKVTPTPLPMASTISKPMALLTTAEKITTRKVFNKGEAVVYKAGNSITLMPGFHAKSGASFVASSNIANEIATDLTEVAVIANQQSVTYNAANSITLKPGFHAEAGSKFVATTATPSTATFVSNNSVISAEETVLVKADEIITLKVGFHAKAGAEFLAIVKK